MIVTTKILDIHPDGAITKMALEVNEKNTNVIEIVFSRHDSSEPFQMISGRATSSNADIIHEAIQLILNTLRENGEDYIDITTVNEEKIQIAI